MLRSRLDTAQLLGPQLDAVVNVSNGLEDLRLALGSSLADCVRPLENLSRLCSRATAHHEQAVGTWASSEEGPELAAEVLCKAAYDGTDEDECRCVALLLQLLSSVARAGGKALASLSRSTILEELMRLLIESDSAELVQAASKLVALCSDDAAGLERLVELHVMAVLMARPSSLLIAAALPRLLRDERLVMEFCEQGGVVHLHSVVMFDQQTTGTLAACVAVIALLGKNAAAARCMACTEGFVASVVSLLSNSHVSKKVRVHVVRALMALALDQVGLPIVETSLVTLLEALMESSDMQDGDEVALTIASFELVSLLCNSRSILSQVDEFGGQDFPRFLLCFLSNEHVLIPLCSLLHILCFGVNKSLIIEGMKSHLAATGDDTVAVTLELLGEKAAVDEVMTAAKGKEKHDAAQVVVARPSSSLESKRARWERKRLAALRELHASERTYSLALFTLTKCFMPLLQPVLSQHEMKVIFGNAEELYALHKGLIKQLDREMKTPETIAIGSIFLDFANSMHGVYSAYMRSNKEALEMLAMKMRAFRRIREMVWEETKKIKQGSLSLENYLVLPMQRAANYSTWLRDIEAVTEDDCTDKALLSAASARLGEVVGGIRTSMRSLPSQRLSQAVASESSKQQQVESGKRATLNASVGFVPRALMSRVLDGDGTHAIKLTKHRTGSVAGTPTGLQSPASSSPAIPRLAPKSPRADPCVMTGAGNLSPRGGGGTLGESVSSLRRSAVSTSNSDSPALLLRKSAAAGRSAAAADGTGAGNLSPRGGAVGSSTEAGKRSVLSSSVDSPVLLARKSPTLNRIASEDATMRSSVSSRVSSAFGVAEKLRVASNKGQAMPFVVHLTSQPAVVVGHGYTRDGLFHFVNLEGEEVLVLPVVDLASKPKKTMS